LSENLISPKINTYSIFRSKKKNIPRKKKLEETRIPKTQKNLLELKRNTKKEEKKINIEKKNLP
jgi:hypothetical protein